MDASSLVCNFFFDFDTNARRLDRPMNYSTVFLKFIYSSMLEFYLILYFIL